MRWSIDKSFDFCYGHRVHNQTLNTDFTENNDGCLVCRHLHGHQGKIKIFLTSNHLNDGMVTDFKHLGFMKSFIDDNLDHKFIMDINDPLISHEVPELCKDEKFSENTCDYHEEGFYTPVMSQFENYIDAIKEKYEGMVFVDFVPTSENICTWIMRIVQQKIASLGVLVEAVEFNETPKSHCRVESYPLRV